MPKLMYSKFIAAIAARPLTTSEFGAKTRPSRVKILFKNAVSHYVSLGKLVILFVNNLSQPRCVKVGRIVFIGGCGSGVIASSS